MSLVKYLVFGSSHDLSLDEKRRLMIPASIRKKFVPERDGEGFFVIEATDGRLCLYPKAYYEAMFAREPSKVMPNPDELAFQRANLGLADEVDWDRQGRILIPERTLNDNGIGKEVSLVGSDDHLELWNRAEWEVERQKLRSERREIARKYEQSKPPESRQ